MLEFFIQYFGILDSFYLQCLFMHKLFYSAHRKNEKIKTNVANTKDLHGRRSKEKEIIRVNLLHSYCFQLNWYVIFLTHKSFTNLALSLSLSLSLSLFPSRTQKTINLPYIWSTTTSLLNDAIILNDHK